MLRLPDFDLYLFDFDGIILDTEPVYYQVFLNVWADYGLDIFIDFSTYYYLSSLGRELFQQQLVARFPQTASFFPQFFQDRDRIYGQRIRESKEIQCVSGIPLMVEYLLDRKKIFGVVTNSSREHTEYFKQQFPLLENFHFWVTREDYVRAKPASDSYRYAYKKFASPSDRVIGFEDSLKGLRALSGIPATLVAINPYLSFSQDSHTDLSGTSLFSFPSLNALLQAQEQNQL